MNGELIRDIREADGLRQKDLLLLCEASNETTISERSLRTAEGSRPVGIDVYHRLARVLGVTPAEQLLADKAVTLSQVRRSRTLEGVDQASKPAILWAEDDRFLYSHARDLFTDEGYDVIQAIDGSETLTGVERHHQRLVAVILDVMMPPGHRLPDDDTKAGMETGLVVARILRSKYPAIPVFILTNVASDLVTARAQAMSRKTYFKAAFPSDSLVRDVIAALRSDAH